MASITWTPEGEKLFQKLIEAVPEQMREAIRPKLLEMLTAKASGDPAGEETVRELVEDLPEPQRSALSAAIGSAPEESPQESGPQLQWTGKSQTMFEIMLGQVPEAMRGVFRGKLTAVITQKTQGGPVADDHVLAVVNEIVPEPFKSAILQKFRELGDYDPKILETIIERHGTSQDSLMYILHDSQDEIGYLPPEALQAISNKTGIPVSTIYNVATFYKAFRLQRPGTHHVKVCAGTACHLKDTSGISADIERAAQHGGMTVEKTLCLGCCDCAPAVEIDGKTYTGDEARDRIRALCS